jgi:hypothetical protein
MGNDFENCGKPKFLLKAEDMHASEVNRNFLKGYSLVFVHPVATY